MAKMTREELLLAIFDKNGNDYEDEDILELLVHEKLSRNINHVQESRLSFGDRMADKLAAFAGSWKFIIGFTCVLALWIIVNVYLMSKPYDPYPFILLNLVLSCIAAIQAPVIMMSQNRQEEKDRLRAKNDYKVNLKAEVIVEDLHEKIEKLFENQQQIYRKLEELENKGFPE
ncbi:MAG: DUF1003 domain-containing protein [Bacillota bacterium]